MSDVKVTATAPAPVHHLSKIDGVASALIYDNPKDRVGEPPSAIAFGPRGLLEQFLVQYAAAPIAYPNARVVDVPFVWESKDGKAFVRHDLSALVKPEAKP